MLSKEASGARRPKPIATRPGKDAPDASGAGSAPVRGKRRGIPSAQVSPDPSESRKRLGRLGPRGALPARKILPSLSQLPDCTPASTPRGAEPRYTFRGGAKRTSSVPSFDPPLCAGKRADRPGDRPCERCTTFRPDPFVCGRTRKLRAGTGRPAPPAGGDRPWTPELRQRTSLSRSPLWRTEFPKRTAADGSPTLSRTDPTVGQTGTGCNKKKRGLQKIL
jgi:hypothetical protein